MGVGWVLAYLTNPEEQFYKDRMMGYSDRVNHVFTFCSAFFIYDLGILFRLPKFKAQFLVHHLSALVGYLIVQRPYAQFYALLSLIMEASSPALSVRTLMLMSGFKGTKELRIVENIFGFSFMIVRIIFGIPVTLAAQYEAFMHYYNGHAPSAFGYWWIMICNSMVLFLNIYWFSLMVFKKVGSK